MRSYLLPLQSKLLILVEQVSYPCRASLSSLQSKLLILVEQDSHPCRANLSSLQSKFLETWWASLGLRPVGGPRGGWALLSLGLWTWAYWACQRAYWAYQALFHILSSSVDILERVFNSTNICSVCRMYIANDPIALGGFLHLTFVFILIAICINFSYAFT